MTIDREALREKVARAICAADPNVRWGDPDPVVQQRVDSEWKNFIPHAKAVLSALDQPAQGVKTVAVMTEDEALRLVRKHCDFSWQDPMRLLRVLGLVADAPPKAAPQPVTTDPLREIVFRYIDRMNDVAPECGDPAERIVSEFARDVNAVLQSEHSQPATTEASNA